jgi:glucose/arabinose dehydrogenase
MAIRRTRLGLLVLAAIAAALCLATPADAKRGVKLKRIGRFHSPTYVTSAPGVPGVVVVERGGRIRLVQGRKRRTFTNLEGNVSTGGERGLLSVAFAPDYASSRLLYVYFTNGGGDIEIAELRADGDGRHASPTTLRPLVIVPHPNHSNHNGGQLQFGPDGMLYAGTGDGGGEGDQPDNAQNPNSRLGKLLRIDPATSAVGVFAIGLRNPYRFSFDLVSDPGQPRIAIGDVGQDRFEEIDYTPRGRAAGRNFGWSVFEGRQRFHGGPAPNYVPPVLSLSHSNGFCAVAGGYVVRGSASGSLNGRYVYGDLCNSRLYSAKLRRGHAVGNRALPVRVSNLVSFGEDARGRVYAVSLSGGVYRLTG